ncbi:hypothetical protein ACFQX6_31305 [Streptosporangium lutulentum]
MDHPDGLAEPRGYLSRLRAASGVWTVVEKILIGSEQLPEDWDCDGTTGYEVLNRITGLFVDPASKERLVELFVAHTGVSSDYAAVVQESKAEVLDLFFTSEIDRLHAVVGSDRRALVELIAAMPVYRAYAVPGEPVPEVSARIVETAGRLAADRLPEGAPVAEVVDRVLYGPAEAVTRFQQTCGPVMAKGVEDTALYRWYPLACLNEVGGEPDRFGEPVGDFHTFCMEMSPGTMTTLSTHDTKRSEDVRARLAVLSELPEEWAAAVGEWSSKVSFDPALDYLAWQNLMAAWPISQDRFFDYLFKAAREAKTSISWAAPDPAYEAGVRDFVTRAVGECGASIAEFADRISPYARANSLGQKLVQLMLPGVPDLYWGNEITDFSLVDPDNRRPVDFDLRRRMLAGAGGGVATGGIAPGPSWDGAKAAGLPRDAGKTGDLSWDEAKLMVTTRALNLRRAAGSGRAVPPAGGRRARRRLRARGPGRDGGHPAAGRAGAARRLGKPHAHAAARKVAGPAVRGRAYRQDPPGASAVRSSRGTPGKALADVRGLGSARDGGRCGDRRGPLLDVGGIGGLVVGGGARGRARDRLPLPAGRR